MQRVCLFCFKDTENCVRFDLYNRARVKIGQQTVWLCPDCAGRFGQGQITMEDVSERVQELADMNDVLRRL